MYCVVLGGGGHAAVLIEAIRASYGDVARAVLDPDAAQWGKDVLGVPVVGSDELLPELAQRGADCFVVGIGTVRAGHPRQRVFDYGLSCGLEVLTVAHPSAIIAPSAKLGRGCQLLPRSIVHTRAQLGENVIVNTGAIVEHDCAIGSHAHIATGAALAGNVRVGEAAHVGIGASVRQGICIGPGAVVGAGAVVVHHVPEGVVVAGVPARELQGANASR